MERKIKNCVYCDDEKEMAQLLNSGLDPNLEGGWPLRLAARLGACSVARRLVQHGANPHLLGESGASALQLAVFSGAHWDSDKWQFLLSSCDSSQLADGAAVAIIFHNVAGLSKILETGRCNTNVPTTLTGKTVEDLAKGYKLHYLLTVPVTHRDVAPRSTPRISRAARTAQESGNSIAPQPQAHHRNLSPSVARFFHQTAGQSALTPPRSPAIVSSPITQL